MFESVLSSKLLAGLFGDFASKWVAGAIGVVAFLLAIFIIPKSFDEEQQSDALRSAKERDRQ